MNAEGTYRLIKKLFCGLQFLLRFKYGNYEAVTKSPQQEKADLRSKGGISSFQQLGNLCLHQCSF